MSTYVLKTPIGELPLTMSVERSGELTGHSRYSSYEAAKKGELPVLRYGKRLVVPTAKLLDQLGIPFERTEAA
ncbi:hypothetical protein ACFOYW_16855 [Gryllotalpicola reticulitermitis]|uniref:DNA-binding protein n=1 Tax=Gryllotalpicola reticulitermitis TaxID=1184153 RepID=A0ABV8QCG2_9MICO